MKPSHYNTLKNTFIVFLVLFNLGCLFVLFKGHERIKKSEHLKESRRELLKEKLGLDDSQMEQFTLLKKEHVKKLRKKQNKLFQLRKEVFAHLGDPDFDIDTYTQEIGMIQQDMDHMAFEHFSKLRALCRPDQYESFDAFAQRIMLSQHSKERSPKR
ncbi:hypothetical protein BFP72_01085 [Reichenbachiella sp. 5M10]|uniref:periplasmic heavy metal sensor n=1 Tax=Reichenbachiella sp. 5M10 TaxID=1889772 RepID=UPI000C152630|nr:periplasmic heavy metal sensor [Reichenbachiella sp. 5M10]PIB34117.1 hypothetical protein BFP72_01085 [Reichenbachiella sp. 5M10]